MKKFTTMFCCLMFMIAGVSLTIHKNDTKMPGHQNLMAQAPPNIIWDFTRNGNHLPLDIQLDLEKRQVSETPIRDSINIIDSVRYVEKVRWKTRYKNAADRTSARNAGEHLAAVIPDSLPSKPVDICAVGREEKPTDSIGPPKVSIILTVDGEEVYKR